MVKKKITYYIFEGIVLLTLFAIRIFRMEQMGLFDYDSVRNYLTIQEMSQGDFSHLFHHISPTFYLIFSPVYLLFEHFLALEYANAAIGVWAVALFTRFLRKHWKLDFWRYLLFTWCIGTATFLVVSSRYFSIENLSLLFFVWILTNYFNHLETSKSTYWYRTWVLIAFAATINYKAILFIPIIFMIELFQINRKLTWKALAFIPLPFLGFSVCYSILGGLLKVGYLNYAKYFYALLFGRATNPQVDKSKFDLDVFYYVKYCYDFENFLIGIGLIAMLYLNRTSLLAQVKRLFGQFKVKVNATFLITYLMFAFVGGFAILAKAPRGMLWAYPLIYACAVYGLNQAARKLQWFVPIALLFFAINLLNINRYIYPYSSSNYAKLAAYIAAKDIEEVTITVGLGLVPFLDSSINWEIAFSEQEISMEKGQYVVIDDYQQIANLGNFKVLRSLSPMIAFKDSSLLSPYLFLEHCEYTNKGYEEALADWKAAQKQRYQLRLVRCE
ncbi:MAG: hypothetical protein ACPGJS_18620 [Flammeovirgaceae bacterium]